jgi:RNA-binding protein
MTLNNKQKAQLKKQAHTLNPIVQIGKKGLTQEQITTIRNDLKHHQLIKIRFNDHKLQKKEISQKIAEETESTIIDIIGNTLILYKPKEQ